MSLRQRFSDRDMLFAMVALAKALERATATRQDSMCLKPVPWPAFLPLPLLDCPLPASFLPIQFRARKI